PGDEEEARLEILEIVGRERGQSLTVDSQHPARQEPCVEREQPGRVGHRCLDVAPVVADDEGVAVEDLHECALHDALRRGGPGNTRWKMLNSCASPSNTISPRSDAASAFARPVTMSSKSGSGTRTTASAASVSCETSTSPRSMRMYHDVDASPRRT